MTVKLLCLFLVTSCVCTLAQPQCSTPWNDCGSTGMKISSVVVSDCCSNPCKVIKGKNSTITVTFAPNSNYSTLSQRLCNIVGKSDCFPAPKDYPTNVCDLISSSCPLSTGKQYTERTTILIPADHFDVKAISQWSYYGTDNKMVGCFQVPVQV